MHIECKRVEGSGTKGLTSVFTPLACLLTGSALTVATKRVTATVMHSIFMFKPERMPYTTWRTTWQWDTTSIDKKQTPSAEPERGYKHFVFKYDLTSLPAVQDQVR